MRFQVDVYHKGDLKETIQKRFVFDTWHDVEIALDVLFPFVGYLNITEISIIFVKEEKENE
jgi:hypothetical protein